MNLKPFFFTVVPPVAIGVVLWKLANGPLTAVRMVGLIFTVGGLSMLTIARIQLGNSFSIAPQAKQLVTRGLYSRIRNPIYLFSALTIAGLFIYMERLFLLVFLAALIPLQYLRARQESRVLEERFGDEYRRYKAATWF